MRNWTCPTSEQWERYLLENNHGDRPELDNHLAACPYCRFIVGQLTREFKAAAHGWESPAVPHPAVYTLYPLAPIDINTPATLLAAQGNEKSEEPMAIALTTADHSFLLRAIRDGRTGETWLYLAAEEPGAERNVLVRPFGGSNEYVTDDRGRVNLGNIEWPDPGHHTAEIHLPRATFVLTPRADKPAAENTIKLTSPAGDTIQLAFSGEGRNRRLDIDIISLAQLTPGSPLRIALREPDTVGIIPLSAAAEPRVSFNGIRTEGKLEIYLYQ